MSEGYYQAMSETAKQTRSRMSPIDRVATAAMLLVMVYVPLLGFSSGRVGRGWFLTACVVSLAAYLLAMWVWFRWRSKRTID